MSNRNLNAFGAAWLAVFLFLPQVRSFACSCAERPSPARALEQSSAVFSGTVIEIAPFENELENIGFLMKRVTFRVIETWKGTNTATKVVLTGNGGGDCGYVFTLGAEYLVYASSVSTPEFNGFSTSVCTRNSLLSTADEDRQFLGEGEKPDRPLLKVARERGKNIFSWQTNWTSFRLETTEQLQSPSSWRPATNYVGIRGEYHVITNEVPLSRSYFRLVR
jgi:hypothetical protein